VSSATQHESAAPAGLVIAGGRSLRFGAEKACALLGGKPLLTWAVERLQSACSVVAVNARPGTDAEKLAQTSGLTVLHDAPGDAAGPLAGVRAGLRWAAQIGVRALAVSPCDAPLLPEDLYVRLVAAAGAAPAMAETAEGPQPLCALWPVSALAALEAALAGGAHPAIWRTLDGIGARRVRFADAAAFANVNTRAELERLAQRFARR